MDISKVMHMTKGIFTMNGTHTIKKKDIAGSHANLLELLINLCGSVIILLITVKSTLLSP